MSAYGETAARACQLLWEAVMDGVEKQPNGQMDVVIVLWREQLLHLSSLEQN